MRPNQKVRIVIDHGAFVLADGQLGFGQAIGEQVMRLGIERAEQHGVGIIALRNSGHLGRIGHWAEMAVQANKISLHFVNSNGLGMIVVPVGGISPRLSANPIAVGVPVKGGTPFILDISTSSIAAGKARVALHRGL